MHRLNPRSPSPFVVCIYPPSASFSSCSPFTPPPLPSLLCYNTTAPLSLSSITSILTFYTAPVFVLFCIFCFVCVMVSLLTGYSSTIIMIVVLFCVLCCCNVCAKKDAAAARCRVRVAALQRINYVHMMCDLDIDCLFVKDHATCLVLFLLTGDPSVDHLLLGVVLVDDGGCAVSERSSDHEQTEGFAERSPDLRSETETASHCV